MATHPSITRMKPTGKVNFMLFGPPGIGKTSLIAEGSRTLIVRPPADHTDAAIRQGSGADEWVVSTWDEMNEVEEFARHNPTEYDWIWIDSISLFQDYGLEDIMAAVEAAKPHRKDGPIDQGEYANNFTRIKKLVRHLVGVQGFNFGLTAHPAELPDNLGNVKLRPWIQGKNMSFTICGYMNIVGFYEIAKDSQGNERRVLRLQQTADYDAKDQFGLFPKYRLVDPTMAKIEAALPKAGSTKPKAARRRVTRKGK